MAPIPPSRASASTPTSLPASSGPIRLDEDFLKNLTERKAEAVLDSFQKFDLEKEGTASLLKLFGERAFKANLRFHETSLPIDDSPDLKILEGAGLCMGLNARGGKLSLAGPIGLGGVQALGGFLDFCRIDAEGDRLQMSECPCVLPYSRDITAEVMESPLGTLFPERRLNPVELTDLLKIKIGAGAGSGAGLGDRILNALYSLQAKIQTDLYEDDPPGTPGGTCHPVWASLELFFDLPVLTKAIQEERYRQFDFEGLLEGSSLQWPGFDLSALPLPEGIRIASGKADLQWRYHPADKKTEIKLNNMEAEILIPELFGTQKVHVTGNTSVTLQAGGSVALHFDDLQVEILGFPSPDPVFQLAGKLSGDLLFKPNAEGKTLLAEAHLKLNEIEISTLTDKVFQIGKSSVNWSGNLQGSLELNYTLAASDLPLHLKADLKGGLQGTDASLRIGVKNLHLFWDGGFHKVGGRTLPDLNRAQGEISGDLEVQDLKNKPLFSLSEASLRLRRSRLELGAKELKVGNLSLTPFVGLDLSEKREGETVTLMGEGEISLLSNSLPLKIGAPLKISTDLKDLQFSIPLTGEQVLGPLHLRGDAEIQGKGNLSEGLISPLENFSIQTTRPFNVEKDGKLVAKNVKISGKGDNRKSTVRLQIPSLLGKTAVDLDLSRNAGSDRVGGSYRVRPQPMDVNSDFRLKDISFEGSFQSSPFPSFLEKPKLFVSGNARTRAEGALSGPLKATYQGSLSYRPEKDSLSLWINPQVSKISVGPLSPEGESFSLEGTAGLQGTYVASLTRHGVVLGGGKVGLNDGTLLLANESDRKVQVLTSLSIVADQLWGIRNGVAHGGGEGIKIESDLHLDSLQEGVPASSGRRHLLYIVDQFPLSLDGYWRLFKKAGLTSGKEGP